MMKIRLDKTQNRIQGELRIFSTLVVLVVAVLCAVVIFGSSFSIHSKLLAVVLMWLYAVFFGISRFEKRFAYLIFVLLIFVFLLSRPIFAQLYGLKWEKWSINTLSIVLSSIFVSIVTLLMSSIISEKISFKPIARVSVTPNERELRILRIVFLIVIAITGLAYYYARIKFFMNFSNADYADIYLEYTSDVPRVVSALSYFFPIAVACFLSMQPCKAEVAAILVLYVGSGVPQFLLGNRGALILPIVFAVVYVLARHSMEKEQRVWVTKKMKVAFVIFVIVAMALLGAMNYTRDGREVLDDSKMPLLADFLYKQGTTFDTLAQGIEYKKEIDALPGDPIYSLNDLREALSYGVIARYLDEKSPLPSGNSLETVYVRGSLSHRLSYVVIPELYLTGHGRGSSYIIETYLDWGLKGVLIVSAIIGVFLSKIILLLSSKSITMRTITVNCLLLIFLMPRSETTRCISFIASPYYWILLLLILIIRMAANSNRDKAFQEIAT